MDDRSDSDLMAMYARGNPEAFDELFRRWEHQLLGYFVKRARSQDHAADLFQEVFLRLHLFREQFDTRQSFGPWVWQIARHVWIDDLRRSRGTPCVGLDEAEHVPVSGEVEARTLARDDIGRLLGVLTPEQQTVTVAAQALGVGYREIARSLGKSVAATKQIGSRAIRRLRRAAGVYG
jgi:RNA polymerase sigma-70 factor (ECF subfamily)